MRREHPAGSRVDDDGTGLAIPTQAAVATDTFKAAVEGRVVGNGGADADEDGVVTRSEVVCHGFGSGAGEVGLNPRSKAEARVQGRCVCKCDVWEVAFHYWRRVSAR